MVDKSKNKEDDLKKEYFYGRDLLGWNPFQAIYGLNAFDIMKTFNIFSAHFLRIGSKIIPWGTHINMDNYIESNIFLTRFSNFDEKNV